MMKQKILTIIALLILICGGIAAYRYFQNEQPPVTEPTVVETPEIAPSVVTPIEPEPEERQVLNEPEEVVELPQLESSDDFMSNALAKLLSNKALMAIFTNEQLIHNIVVTIDNLPRQQVSMRKMPIKKAPGKFLITENEEGIFISPNNKARYAKYVNFAESVEPKQLVRLYVQLYPLFQKAYEELGYPDQYFNDRLLVVLDNLLATPEVNAPVPLVKPKFFYQYADETLENRSIGQRILMRIGSYNQGIVKTKLAAIKQELKLNMHDQQVDQAQ